MTLAYVVSLNLKRRHLSESQRALIAAEIATFEKGQRKGNPANAGFADLTQAEAARLLNVSVGGVERARVVHKHGTNALKEAVRAGEISIHPAAEIARLPKSEQRAAS